MDANIFISYSHKDEPSKRVAARLKQDLEATESGRYSVFMDDKSIEPGDHIPESVQGRISDSTLLFALVSEGYLASTYCVGEWNYATSRAIPILPALFSDKNDAETSEGIGERFLGFLGDQKPLKITSQDHLAATEFARIEIIARLAQIAEREAACVLGFHNFDVAEIEKIAGSLLGQPDAYKREGRFERLSGVVIIAEACAGLVNDEPTRWRDRITNHNVIVSSAFFGLGAVLLAEMDNRIFLHLSEKTLEELRSKNPLRAVICAALVGRKAIQEKAKDYKGNTKIFVLLGNQIAKRKRSIAMANAPGASGLGLTVTEPPSYVGGDLGAIQRVLKSLNSGDIVISEKARGFLLGGNSAESATNGLGASLIRMSQPFKYLDGFEFRHEYSVYRVSSHEETGFARINENRVRSLVILDAKEVGSFGEIYGMMREKLNDELHNITYIFPAKGARKIIMRLASPDDPSHIETMKKLLLLKAFPVSHFIHTVIQDPELTPPGILPDNNDDMLAPVDRLSGSVGALIFYQFNSIDVNAGDKYLKGLSSIAASLEDAAGSTDARTRLTVLDVGKLYGQFEAYSVFLAPGLPEVERMVEESLQYKYLTPLETRNVNIEVMPFSIETGCCHLLNRAS